MIKSQREKDTLEEKLKKKEEEKRGDSREREIPL
jgi:hypothetical protein